MALLENVENTVPLDAGFYDLTQTAQGALVQGALAAQQQVETAEERANAPSQQPPIMQLRAGYAESPRWMMVQAAEFDPEPLTVAHVRRRAIWSSPGIISALLELLASEGWLDRVDETYYLTTDGRTFIDNMANRRQLLFANYAPLPLADLGRLEQFMRRVLEASLQSADPPGSWCLVHSRRRAPGREAPALEKIFQHCADFNAFRDDAHMAAFMPRQPEAYIWETLAFIAQDTPGTPDALFSKLAYRGYSRQDFAAALTDLQARGWLKRTADQYEISVQGQTVRAEVERLTDQYFYAPWSALTAAEIQEMHNLLTQLITEQAQS